MQRKAWLLGANFVIACRIDTDEVSSKGKAGYSAVIYGTPVLVEVLTIEQQRRFMLRS